MSIIRSWKLNWLISQYTDLSHFRKQRRELSQPWKYWLALLTKLSGAVNPKPVLLKLRNGGRFYVHDFLTLYIYNEIFVERQYAFEMSLEDNTCVIDIGANTGLFALWLRQRYPDILLYCFEPFPGNFRQMETNFRESDLKNIFSYCQGAGGTSRQEKLFLSPTNLGAHSIFEDHAHSEHFTMVDIRSLEEIVRLTGKTCSLLKLDCEGAEYEIIKSITPEIAESITRIIFEPSAHLYEVSELTAHLESLGYHMLRTEGNYIACRP